jgi:acyl-coenzyme A synthetase/AMP-(fatty) acid ligase
LVGTGRGDQLAPIYDSPVTGTIEVFTYRELRDQVATFAGALAGLGVGKGDSRDHLYADGSQGCCGNYKAQYSRGSEL